MVHPSALPASMKALVLRTTEEPPTVESIQTPQPTYGSAVVKVLSANVISYMRDVYNGSRGYTFATPFIPGTSFVGRIAAVGPDATRCKAGDLVFVDTFVRSRDNPGDQMLAGLHDGHTEGSKKLFRDVFHDWSYAEYCRCPLESLHILEERKLLSPKGEGGLGYEIDHLGYLPRLTVPYGGLRDIELRAGQTVIVAPATGPFGGAAVVVALAMGARVIAMGRNRDALANLGNVFTERLETVPITGDVRVDLAELQKHGPIDAFFDIGPPVAAKSTHLMSAFLALRPGGRVSLMGGYEEITIPHGVAMHKSLKVYFKWMYEREDIDGLIQMVEVGILKLGEIGGQVMGKFPLEQWKEAFDMAHDYADMGQETYIVP